MVHIQLTRKKAAFSPSPSFKTCNRCKKNWAQRSLSTGCNPRAAVSSIYSHIHSSFVAASWTIQKCLCACLFAGGVKNTTGLLSRYLFWSQQRLIFSKQSYLSIISIQFLKSSYTVYRVGTVPSPWCPFNCWPTETSQAGTEV